MCILGEMEVVQLVTTEMHAFCQKGHRNPRKPPELSGRKQPDKPLKGKNTRLCCWLKARSVFAEHDDVTVTSTFGHKL